MKAKEKQQLTATLKRINTHRLRYIAAVLDDWDHIHRLKKGSWFWLDNGNASERASKERYYGRDEEIEIGPYRLTYWSDVSMSRRNTYWSDALEMPSHPDINVTFGDIAYILETIGEIRKARAAAKARKEAS
ncbi:MAG: hypothetical protein IKD88_00890 [Lachnospiraceae bacterium]|nr:hypothetical protein [Lachnospiraceae bacterium]